MSSTHAEGTSSDRTSRSNRGRAAFVALLVGLVVGVVLVWSLGGNPLSSANEVVYQEVIVGSVSESEDQICWSTGPTDRDESRTCAILALDPQASPPSEGDEVTIGVVDISAPGGQSQRQVVFAAPPAAEGQ